MTAAILRATADLGAAHGTFGEAVAARAGLAATDVGVLRLLGVDGPMTVGRIGDLAGLTTGATTRLVDRLEQAGFVRRVADPADRRRVMVELVDARSAGLLRAWDPIDDAGLAVLDGLDDEAVGAIEAYLAACVGALQAASLDSALPVSAGGDGSPAASTAPVASATSGRLVFVTGAPAVTVGGQAGLGTELYRARFSGAVPSARVRDGIVTIRYPRFAWFDWRARIGDQRIAASAHWKRDETEVVLNAALPWSVELRGGVTSITADLRAIAVTRFELAGGTGQATISLGRPAGVVPIRLAGGVSDVTVRRPAGVPVILAIHGGYRKATLDGTAAWSPGRAASPGAESAPDRYEIEIRGGANRVAVTAG